MSPHRRRIAVTAAVLLFASCLASTQAALAAPRPGADSSAQLLGVEVLDAYPHDTAAFTQGLELHEGLLYESTGRRAESDVRRSVPETGRVQALQPLPDSDFAEGLTIVGDTLWQLTWTEETAYRRDVETLAEVGRASYAGEGWGLCHDDERDVLAMSDGSAELALRDPETFEALSTVQVHLDGEPVERINELECVDGDIWANIWLSEDIVRIDPGTGEVTAVVDASGLLTPEEGAQADVLNGIAALPDDDAFLLTGKLWPWVFLVEFVPAG